MASGTYNSLGSLAAGAGVGWASATQRILLVSSSYTYDPDHATVADVSASEISVSGYSRQTLANCTVTTEAASNRVALVADVTQSTTTALDAVAVPGAVAVSSASTQSTTTALDATASPGAVSATADVASSSTTALDPVVVPGPVSLTGDVTASTTSALDAVAVPGAVSPSVDVATSTTTALDATAVPGAVALSAAVTQSTTSAFDAVAGYLAPRGDRLSVALALPVRRASLSLPARSLSLAIPRRQTTVALPVRAVSLALPRRLSVADIQGFTQGDRCESTHTLTVTLSGTAQTIDQPLSLAARLYARGSTTLTTSIAITVGDCTGWDTTSVVAPVIYTSAISAALPVGTYNVEIVATYVDGTVRWPENGSATQIVVRAPGAT